MENRQIVFIVYVSDVESSVKFYTELLDLKVAFESPRYVAMNLGAGAYLALWTGKKEELEKATGRISEVCLNLAGGEEDILATYDLWRSKGVSIAEEPHQDVFGTTFIALDPDGNRIRVAPVD